MNVYVVIFTHPHEYTEVERVFNTQEKAEKYVADALDISNGEKITDYQIKVFEVE